MATTKITITIFCVAMFTYVHAHIVPAAPILAPAPVFAKVEEYDPHPQYSYGYDVQDALTGDSKTQYETRNGDVVSGSYSLIEADGTRRVVEYTADPINGFNAVVHREPAVIRAAVPAVPAIPAIPAVPAVPAIPAIPPVPAVPAIPAVPGLPAVVPAAVRYHHHPHHFAYAH